MKIFGRGAARSKPWTLERIKQLSALADGTKSARQIADALGVSRGSVIGILWRHPEYGKLFIREEERPRPIDPPKVKLQPPPIISGHRCITPGCANSRQRGYLDARCAECRRKAMPDRTRTLVW